MHAQCSEMVSKGSFLRRLLSRSLPQLHFEENTATLSTVRQCTRIKVTEAEVGVIVLVLVMVEAAVE